MLLDFICRCDRAILKGVHAVLLSMFESQLLHFFKLLLLLQLHLFPHTHEYFTAEWVVLVEEEGVGIVCEEQVQAAFSFGNLTFQNLNRLLVFLNKFLLLCELLELVHISSLQLGQLLISQPQLFL